jgi:hypothetical protein
MLLKYNIVYNLNFDETQTYLNQFVIWITFNVGIAMHELIITCKIHHFICCFFFPFLASYIFHFLNIFAFATRYESNCYLSVTRPRLLLALNAREVVPDDLDFNSKLKTGLKMIANTFRFSIT